MTGNELAGVETFLYNRLAGDATLQSLIGGTASNRRIYDAPGPEGAALPFVIFTFISSPDTNVVGADQRTLTRPLYQVEVVTTGGSFAGAAPVATRIDQLLMGAAGTVPAYSIAVSGIYREAPIKFIDIPSTGIRYNHLGGRYRCFVAST